MSTVSSASFSVTAAYGSVSRMHPEGHPAVGSPSTVAVCGHRRGHLSAQSRVVRCICSRATSSDSISTWQSEQIVPHPSDFTSLCALQQLSKCADFLYSHLHRAAQILYFSQSVDESKTMPVSSSIVSSLLDQNHPF